MSMKRCVAAALMTALLVVFCAVPALGAVELPVGGGTELEGRVVILHTNDSHGRVDENMGFAAVKALKDAYEKAGAEVLLLDAGDTFHGMPFATLNTGADMVGLLNDAGYDAMTTGNHDYNYGTDRLAELAGELDFPVLAANVIDDATGQPLFDANMVVEKGGLRLGVFGLATPETAYKTNPLYVEGITFDDPAAVAAEQVELLQEEGVDYIIALAHLGVGGGDYTSDALAAAVPGIDLVIDGHSHTEMEDGRPLDTSIQLVEHGDTVIASTGCYIANIGVVVLEQEDGIAAGLVDGEAFTDRDAGITADIEAVKDELTPLLNEVVGQTPHKLLGEREYVRTQETNMGDFTADAILWATGADATFMNGGTIRASIEPGEITREDLITVYPFGNYIMVKEVTGQALKDAMEHGVAKYPESAAVFPHPGGMTFTLNAEKPAGSRVEDLQIAGEPVDLKATYTLAVNDFLGMGGDEYTMLADAPEVGSYGALEEIFTAYLATGPELPEESQQRITVVGGDNEQAAQAAYEAENGAAKPASEAPEEDAAEEDSSVSSEDASGSDSSGEEAASASLSDTPASSEEASSAPASSADASSEEASSTPASSSDASSEDVSSTPASSADASDEDTSDEETPAAEAGDEETAAEDTPKEDAPAEDAPGTYTVQEGDVLRKIAREELGDGRRWEEIYRLNRSQIANPDLIYPGQVLLMPA